MGRDGGIDGPVGCVDLALLKKASVDANSRVIRDVQQSTLHGVVLDQVCWSVNAARGFLFVKADPLLVTFASRLPKVRGKARD